MSDKRDISLKRVSNRNPHKSDNVSGTRSSSSGAGGSSSVGSSGGSGGSPIRISKLGLSNRSRSGGSGDGTDANTVGHSNLHLRNISNINTTSNKISSATAATTTTATISTVTSKIKVTATSSSSSSSSSTTTTTTTTTILRKSTTDVTILPINAANISNITFAASAATSAMATTAATATARATATATFNELPLNDDKSFAVYFMVNFQYVCIFTAILPLFTLFTCFITAYVFQYDEVHETHCRVYNIVPSISAITGVSPQRYFWRFSIALHLGPRVPIAFIYKNYYRHMLKKLASIQIGVEASNANLLIKLILILNCIEIASLGGVTYISNRENYPIHEKIFIIFMICSLCYMLATIKLNDILHKDFTELSQQQRDSIKWKKILFVLSIVSTIGLLIFFAKHRFYCHDLAFSWFAFFEYLIAIANMLFHFTVIWDFPTQYMMVVQAPYKQLNELFCSSINSSSSGGNSNIKSAIHLQKID